MDDIALKENMTVADLIATLQKLDQDKPIAATWEGIVTDIKAITTSDNPCWDYYYLLDVDQ